MKPSRYFKFGNKVYSFRDSTVIGRVAPFESIFDRHSISRIHCELFIKNKKLYIKRLSQKSSVRINGKRLKYLKTIVVSNNDEIYLGDQKLELIENYNSDDVIECEVFKKTKSKGMMSVIYEYLHNLTKLQKKLVLMIPFGLLFLPIEFDENLFSKIDYVEIIVTTLICYMLASIQLGLVNFFKMFELTAASLSLGEEEFTLFFDDSNMNIKYKEVLNLYMKKSIIFIKTEENLYLVSKNIKNNNQLYKKLLSKCINNKKEKVISPLNLLGAMSLALIIVLNEIPLNYQYYAHLVLLPLCLLLLTYYYPFKTEKHKKRVFIIASLFVVAMILNSKYEKEQMDSLAKCINEPSEVCSSLNFGLLSDIYDSDKKMQTLAISKICEYEQDLCNKAKSKFYVSRSKIYKNRRRCLKKDLKSCQNLDFSVLPHMYNQKKLKELSKTMCELDKSLCNKIPLKK